MSLEDNLNSVALFHDAFKIGNRHIPTADIGEEFVLRYELLKEENQEYFEACKKKDLVEIADALGDQLYVLLGTILRHGLQDKISAVFEEIQKSNLSKLDSNGEPIFRADGKILKGEHYMKPDIASILKG